MSDDAAWFDAAKMKDDLAAFFETKRDQFGLFGSTVNQTFEAFVVAQVVSWYRQRGWSVEVNNPPSKKPTESAFRLKFSTRGRPDSYSYVRCVNTDGSRVQIRHQLRVATKAHRANAALPANICLDVAVIADVDLRSFGTDDCVPNEYLVTFGEAKHMSAYAELVASFLGLVYELSPRRLKRIRVGRWGRYQSDHLAPFLYVSGRLWRTGQGIVDTIEGRRFDLDVYSRIHKLTEAIELSTAKPSEGPPPSDDDIPF